MYSYVNGNTIHDIQAQRLFTRIDEQLERWNKKYGSITQPTRPEATSVSVKEKLVSGETGNSLNVNSGNNSATANTTTIQGQFSTTPTTTISNSEDKLTSSELLSRIAVLEKQLRSADDDRLNLRQLLSKTERKLSEVLNAQKALQNEWLTFREEMLRLSRKSNEDEITVSASASNRESDKYHSTHFVHSHQSNNNNSTSSNSTFSGPPTVTSTELANTQGVSSSIGFRMNEGVPSAMLLMTTSSLGIEPAQQRRMVLEHLVRRLSVPLGS
ncbi:hypothetical protein LSM04_004462 [Trypanosoma melophagium]|uniref:uncharacterized protein n=1 Tax=Trypanosoma melophagium TaxID=715481 RepID=UPI00351A0444|nr:hypothetical protein LSM04_004462 [Trypanosoma melophagium]